MNWDTAITIDALKPKLGDVIQLCVDARNVICFSIENRIKGIMSATVVALDAKDKNVSHLVGWKEGEVSSPGSNLYASMMHVILPTSIIDCQYLPDIATTYPRVEWIDNKCLVMVMSSVTSIKSSGMHCAAKYCNEFNNYAQPNQPDGTTYLCWSCKSKPACLR